MAEPAAPLTKFVTGPGGGYLSFERLRLSITVGPQALSRPFALMSEPRARLTLTQLTLEI